MAEFAPEGFTLKLARARQHLETLQTEITAYYKREPFQVVRDARAGRTEFRVRIVEPIPATFATIVGDVLQNTRSALDHLVWRLGGLKSSRDTAFPIYTDRAEYFATDKQGRPAKNSGLFKVAALLDEAQRVIETMQPYHHKDLGLTLRLLHDFARIDRHRLLHLVGGANDDLRIEAGRRDSAGRLVMTGDSRGDMQANLGAFQDGSLLASFSHPKDVEVHCAFGFYIAMRDSDGDGTYYPVEPSLSIMVHSVQEAVVPSLQAFVPEQAAKSWASEPTVTVDLGDSLVLEHQPMGAHPYRVGIRKTGRQKPKV